MGNILPDICICKEREGKNMVRRHVMHSMSDHKVKFTDYLGITANAKTLDELIKPFKRYIIYEILCIKDSEEIEHSVVKMKCFGSYDYLGIYVKVVYVSAGIFIVTINSLSQDEESGTLEYIFKNKPEKKASYNTSLSSFMVWLNEVKQEPAQLLKDGENIGKQVYFKLKAIMNADN